MKQAVSVPVFANGNILFQEDIQRCLDHTGCDAVMTAEGNLYNPSILNGLLGPPVYPSIPEHLPKLKSDSYMSDPEHLPCPLIALEYLEIVRLQETNTTLSALKGHLFKILRPALMQNIDLRDRMGEIRKTPASWQDGSLQPWIDICEELWRRMCQSDAGEDEIIQASGVSYWLTQPYFRPGPCWARKRNLPGPQDVDGTLHVFV